MSGFALLVGAVQQEAFSGGKLAVLGEAARANVFAADQVRQLVALLTFGSDKLAALRLLAPRIVDPENRFLIYGAFTFDSEKAQARRILGG